MKIYELIWFGSYGNPNYNNKGVHSKPENTLKDYPADYFSHPDNPIHPVILKQADIESGVLYNTFAIVEKEVV